MDLLKKDFAEFWWLYIPLVVGFAGTPPFGLVIGAGLLYFRLEELKKRETPDEP